MSSDLSQNKQDAMIMSIWCCLTRPRIDRRGYVEPKGCLCGYNRLQLTWLVLKREVTMMMLVSELKPTQEAGRMALGGAPRQPSITWSVLCSRYFRRPLRHDMRCLRRRFVPLSRPSTSHFTSNAHLLAQPSTITSRILLRPAHNDDYQGRCQ